MTVLPQLARQTHTFFILACFFFFMREKKYCHTHTHSDTCNVLVKREKRYAGLKNNHNYALSEYKCALQNRCSEVTILPQKGEQRVQDNVM